MKRIDFVTDLDRTIVHAKNKGFRCVEYIGHKEITYMTDKSYSKLKELLEKEEFNFIPCTMRNIEQTLRIDFIKEYKPEIIICSNGAQIYINGELDLEWDKRMKNLIISEEIDKQMNFIESLNIDCIEIRNIEDFYITIKCKDINEAKMVYEVLKDKFEANIEIIQIRVKIFIIDKRINKINALDYLINKYELNNLITAGDSYVDKDFTTRGKAILPKHASFRHNDAFITEKEGIYSTEDLLDYIGEELEKIDS